MINKNHLDKLLVVLSVVLLFSMIAAPFILLESVRDPHFIDGQTIAIVILLIVVMLGVVMYNFIMNCNTIFGWFKKKQHTRKYQKVIDKEIFTCYTKKESFLCDEKFRFCPSCGKKINERCND